MVPSLQGPSEQPPYGSGCRVLYGLKVEGWVTCGVVLMLSLKRV